MAASVALALLVGLSLGTEAVADERSAFTNDNTPAAAWVVFDLTEHHAPERVLANPDKGWYHHWYDNSVDKYLGESDDELLAIPGMDHVYLRLAWAYLEPEPGRYDWSWIDDAVTRFIPLGLGVSLRISCKETGGSREEQRHATPRFVMEAGANGGYYANGEPTGPDGCWEPRFDDPVFLEHLDRFLAALGERYDGAPWLRYVDVGSVGDWGEGHTFFGSRRPYGYATRKRHLDLHREHFPTTQLVVTDDFVTEVRDARGRERLHEVVLRDEFTYRDDSVLVDWYVKQDSDDWSVSDPQLFEAVYRQRPTILELQHYSHIRQRGNWIGRPGSSVATKRPGTTGADYFRNAIDRLRATYIGYHGDAKRWLDENPELTGELLNRCGYWYFLDQVTAPTTVFAGDAAPLTLTWTNRGVAPAYRRYRLELRVSSGHSEWTHTVTDAYTAEWLPGESTTVSTAVPTPPDAAAGAYRVGVRLWAPDADRSVEIGLAESLRDEAGFYDVAAFDIVRP